MSLKNYCIARALGMDRSSDEFRTQCVPTALQYGRESQGTMVSLDVCNITSGETTMAHNEHYRVKWLQLGKEEMQFDRNHLFTAIFGQ